MPRIRVGIWLTMVGIALVAQGCWDDESHELTLLGEGGCRTADRTEGRFTTVSAASSDECKAQCFAGETPCVAFEYNANNNICEIHHQPITSVAEVKGVACYVVN